MNAKSMAPASRWRDELERLRIELIEKAWALDRRGQHEAADVAMITAARLAEIVVAPWSAAAVSRLPEMEAAALSSADLPGGNALLAGQVAPPPFARERRT